MAGPGELSGRTALVTGGARGIGRAIVEALSRAGAEVVFTSRSPDPEDAGVGRLHVQADQGEDADWTRVVAATLERFGRLDVLVLSAGINPSAPIEQMTVERFDGLNRVNLRGVFLGLRHGVEAMRRHGEGGSVVMIGSIVGLVGAAEFGAYAAAKDGVRLMAKAAALELGPERIRVNSVHPGMIDTDMTAPFPKAQIEPGIPLGRFGRASEIGDCVRFLACDRSRFMTGAELVADGGWTAQ